MREDGSYTKEEFLERKCKLEQEIAEKRLLLKECKADQFDLENVLTFALRFIADLVDKLRYWEKETLEMSDEEIEKRLGHLAVFLERLKKAYVDFAETDL